MSQNKADDLKHYYRWIWIGGFFQGLWQSLIVAGIIIVVIAVILGIVGLPYIIAVMADVVAAIIAVVMCSWFSIGQAEKAVYDKRQKIGVEIHEVTENIQKQHKDGETRSHKQTTKVTKRR
jgi:hypothetical protein